MGIDAVLIRQLAGSLSGLTAGVGVIVLLVFARLKVKNDAVKASAIFTLAWVVTNSIIFLSIFMSITLRSHIVTFGAVWIVAQIAATVAELMKIRAWRNYQKENPGGRNDREAA